MFETFSFNGIGLSCCVFLPDAEELFENRWNLLSSVFVSCYIYLAKRNTD